MNEILLKAFESESKIKGYTESVYKELEKNWRLLHEVLSSGGSGNGIIDYCIAAVIMELSARNTKKRMKEYNFATEQN